MEREENTQISKAEPSNETATLTYKMKASTGSECTGEQHGISPEHWGRICAAIANAAPPAQVPDGLQPAIRRAIQALKSRMCSECGDEGCCMPHVRQARDELIAMLSAPNPKGGEA